MTALFTIQSSFIDCCLLSSFLKPHDCSFSYKDSHLKDTQLTFEDMKHIKSELNNLEESYKAAFESTNNYKQHLNTELQDPTRIKWELEHQTKRNHNYKACFDKLAKDIAELKDRLSKIGTRRWSFPSAHAFSSVCDGSSRSLSLFPVTTELECRVCLPGWIWFDSMCYFFPFETFTGYKSWPLARQFCQLYGGDLVVINSTDKEVGEPHLKLAV